jgi:hypothetical protein
VLRADYELGERLRKTRKPLDLDAIQIKIDTLKKAEAILGSAINKYGCYSVTKVNARRTTYRPGFITKRRISAAAVLRAEIRRLSAFKKRHTYPGPGKGRQPNPIWGLYAQSLANFVKEKTQKPQWNLVGKTLQTYFPEIYKPADRPERDSLGLWAYTLAKRFRRLRDKDPVRYVKSIH